MFTLRVRSIVTCIFFMLYFPVVTVSFNPVVYTVNEDAGSVELQIKIGSTNVTVTLSTQDGRAVG